MTSNMLLELIVTRCPTLVYINRNIILIYFCTHDSYNSNLNRNEYAAKLNIDFSQCNSGIASTRDRLS